MFGMHKALQQRASLFVRLHRIEQAGLDAARGWQILEQEEFQGPIAKQVSNTARFIKQGKRVSDTGKATGLWNAFEARLISLGENSGKLEAVYQMLAAYYEERSRRVQRIVGRMALPVAVFFLAMLISPLPAIVKGTLTISAYLGVIAARILLVAMVLILAKGFFNAWQEGKLPDSVYRQCGKLPVFGVLITRQSQLDFLQLFNLCFSAGMPVSDAALNAAQSVINRYWSWRWMDVAGDLQRGLTVTQVFTTHGVLPDSQGMAMVSVGEAAGRLEDMLRRYSETVADDLQLRWDVVLEWLPRIFYFGGIALFVLS